MTAQKICHSEMQLQPIDGVKNLKAFACHIVSYLEQMLYPDILNYFSHKSHTVFVEFSHTDSRLFGDSLKMEVSSAIE
ncbi:MAG: hypothetical protein Q8908_00455 [Bacteroidota bacterium]|nr:hypothetical protein [Bacteroidota bacterium]